MEIKWVKIYEVDNYKINTSVWLEEILQKYFNLKGNMFLKEKKAYGSCCGNTDYRYMTINGEVKEDNAYRKILKNLDDVEDYNKWVEFRSHVAPWLVKFKKYQNV